MKKKYLSLLLKLIALSTILHGQPAIISFTPSSGPIGTIVNISGTNFNTTPASNIVFFGGTRATVNTASTNNLNVTVPQGATYQYISVTNSSNNLTAYSAAPFIVTFLCGDIINIGSFAAKVDSSTGAKPREVSVSDIDGDGKLDLIVLNYDSHTVSLSKNTSIAGNISFDEKIDIATVGTPFGLGSPDCIAIGDIDGDGKPDLVIGNSNFNTVSVYKNTSFIGVISFAAKIDLALGLYVNGVSIGDLDGDGKPELSVANGNSISLFRNTTTSGIISFAAKIDYAIGISSNSISIGDLDENGKPDLVISNGADNTVSVFKNTSNSGAISFAAKIDLPTGISPNYMSIGDIDGDGKLDFCISNYGSNTVSLFLNTSISGIVSFAAKVDYGTGVAPRGVTMGDLDGDGKLELVIANSIDSTVSIFKNLSTNGVISFAPKVDFEVESGPLSASLGDLNGDGKPDIMVVNSFSNTVSLFRNQVSPLFMTNQNEITICNGGIINIALSSNLGATYEWVANDNLNTTGENITTQTSANLTDTILNNSSTVQTVFYTVTPISTTTCGAGTPQIIKVTTMPTLTMTNVNTITISSGSSINILLASNVASTYSWIAMDNQNTTGESLISRSTANLNDTLINNTTSAQTITYIVTPTSTIGSCGGAAQIISVILLPVPTITSFTPSFGPVGTIVTIHGTNFDSIPENNIVFFGATMGSVIAASDTSIIVTVPIGSTYKYISVTNLITNLTTYSVKQFVQTFETCSIFNSNSFDTIFDYNLAGYPREIAVGDLNGDGKADIAVTDGTSNFISVFINTSIDESIAFAPKIDFASGSSPGALLIADMDGDGKPELITSSNGSFSILRNTCVGGTISFASQIYFGVGGNFRGFAVGDLDSDGKPDIVLIKGNRYITIYKNTSSIGNLAFANLADYVSGTPGLNGSGPSSISIDDLDGDGKPDISVSNTLHSLSISIFRNTSTVGISFSPKIDIPISYLPSILKIGDLDMDGKPDIVVNCANATISYLLKNSSVVGNITFSLISNISTPHTPRGLSLGDLNGDGKPDLVVNDFAIDRVCVFKNISSVGSILFTAPIEYSTGSAPNANALGDFNGDGKTEIVVTNANDYTVSVFKNSTGLNPPTIYDDLLLCNPDQIPLSPSGAQAGEDYKWYDALTGGNLLQSNGTTYTTPFISDSTTYFVTTYSVYEQCETSPRIPVTITFYDKAIITQNGNVLSSSSTTNNSWYLNGVFIPGAVFQNYTVMQNGTYTLSTYNHLCFSMSDPLVINNLTTNELTKTNFEIFPNPSNGEFVITNLEKEITIQIFDIAGRIIYQTISKKNFEIIDLGNRDNGIYFVRLSSNSSVLTKKISISK